MQTRVMLALLADPVTCRYTLKVNASEAVVEITGAVPNQQVRGHALNVAERASNMNVTDSLRIQPGAWPAVPVKAPAQLENEVLAALAQGPERYIRDLTVQAHATGMVTVYGTVPSLEHQLAVSQCVRGVSGVTAVDCQLAVRSFRYEGKAYTLVAADGRYVMAGLAPAPVTRIQAVEVAPSMEAATMKQAAAAPEPEMPTMVSAISKAIKKRQGLIDPASEQSDSPLTQAIASAAVSQPATVVPAATKSTVTLVEPVKPVRAVSQPAAPMPTVATSTVTSVEPVKPVRAATPVVAKPAVTTAKPATTVQPVEKVRVQSPPASTPAQRPYSFGTASAAPSVAAPTTAKQTTGVALASAPAMSKGSDLVRTAASQPIVIMQEKLPLPVRSNVSTGVVVFDDTDDSPPINPAVATAALQGWLKDRVLKTCGKDGHDLEVVLRSPAHMTVDVKTRDASTAQQLSRKILAMQELEAYKVTLKVQVAP